MTRTRSRRPTEVAEVDRHTVDDLDVALPQVMELAGRAPAYQLGGAGHGGHEQQRSRPVVRDAIAWVLADTAPLLASDVPPGLDASAVPPAAYAALASPSDPRSWFAGDDVVRLW